MHNCSNINLLMDFSDEDLVAECKDNDLAVSILISRYARIICNKAIARSQSAIDSEDLIQEGLMGLFSAIRTFSKEREIKFSTYANVCITNSLTNALVKCNHTKIMSDFSELESDEDSVYDSDTPESIFLEKEKVQEIFQKINVILSEKEWQIFQLFLTGSTYDQMARQLNISPKTVDNAIQRVRRKLKSVWRVEEFSN